MKSIYDLKQFRVTLTYLGDLSLDNIIVGEKKQGTGTAVLQELCEFADYYGKRIILTPALKDRHHGTTSQSRLIRFYKRFGFVENKGRYKDFRISAMMVRNPR